MKYYKEEIGDLLDEFNRKLKEIKLVVDFEGYYVEVAGTKYNSGTEIADLSDLLLDTFDSLICAKRGVEHLQRELQQMYQARVR